MGYLPNYALAWKYIKSDFVRYGYPLDSKKIVFNALFAINHCFTYSFWFRLAKVKNGILYPLAKIMHRRLSRKYGIQIPVNTDIGFGFYIGHGVGLIINPTAKIGNNVNLSQFTTIGAHGNAAVIGDNVYIGPSVCIVNEVKIGNNSTIGAGAVVVTDIPEFATAAGVPAKILNYNSNGKLVNNRFKL